MLHIILLTGLLFGTNGDKTQPSCNVPDSTVARQQQAPPKKSPKLDGPKSQKKEADQVTPKVHLILLDGIARR